MVAVTPDSASGSWAWVHDVKVECEGAVSVKVLPGCIFGMTRLVTSVKEGLSELEDVTSVEVDVAWDQIGKSNLAPQSGNQILKPGPGIPDPASTD